MWLVLCVVATLSSDKIKFHKASGFCAEKNGEDAKKNDLQDCSNGTTIWNWEITTKDGTCAQFGYSVEWTAWDCDGGRDSCTCWVEPSATPTLSATVSSTETVDFDCSCKCRNFWTGGACDICDVPYGGDHCNECKQGYVGYPQCTECDPAKHCNGRGTVYVDFDTCKCTCTNHWQGERCETCEGGYAGTDCDDCAVRYIKNATGLCELCTPNRHCNGHASFATTLPSDPTSCYCRCTDYWEGADCNSCDVRFEQSTCDECAAGRFSKPSCLPCTTADYCNGRAANAIPTPDGMSCTCVGCSVPWAGQKCEVCPGQYQGTECDQCVAGRHSWPACTLCDTHLLCNGNADATTSDGKVCSCICRNQWFPPANCKECNLIYDSSKDCGACAPGRVNYPLCTLCTSEEHCNGRAVSVTPNADATGCICTCRNQWTDSHCGTCPPQFSGTDCNECASGHIGYSNEGDRCRPCSNERDCSGHAFPLLVTSDRDNNECVCKCVEMWSGDDCSICIGQFNASANCGNCSEGRINHPLCDVCTAKTHCNDRAVAVYPSGDKRRCVCDCKNYWEGPTCAECPPYLDANEDCNACAVHYYDASNATSDGILCLPVIPYHFMLTSTNKDSFRDFNKPLDPPVEAELQDGDSNPIEGQAKEVSCTCSLYECEVLDDPLTTTMGYGYVGESGPVYCTEEGCGDAEFSDEKCNVISTVKAYISRSATRCKCDPLVPSPPPEEEARGFQLTSIANATGDWDRLGDLSWHTVPRRYVVVVSLDVLNSDSENSTGVTVMPLVIPIPQRMCGSDKIVMLGRPEGEGQCADCREGLICDGSLRTKVQPGYWRYSEEVLRLPSRCPNEHSCLGNEESASREALCASGSADILCGNCTEGRLGPSGCSSCHSRTVSIVLTVLCGLGMVVGVLSLVKISLKNTIERPDPLPQYVKILVSMVQILAVLRTLNLEWGVVMEQLLLTSSSANSLAGIPGPTICLLPADSDLEDRMWVWVFLPLIMAGHAWFASFIFSGRMPKVATVKWKSYIQDHNGGGTTAAVQKKLRETEVILDCELCEEEYAECRCKECKRLICDRCALLCRIRKHVLDPDFEIPLEGTVIELPKSQIFATAYLIILNFSFTLLVDELTQPLICSQYLHPEDGIIEVASADTRIECRTDSLVYRGSLVFFLLYGLGFPLAFAAMLTYEKKNLSRLRCMSTYGFLYTNYRKKYYYWESIVLLRKVLVVLSVSVPKTDFAKCFYATWVLFVSCLLNLICVPYREQAQQRLDTLGLFAGSCTLLAGIWVADNNQGAALFVILVALYTLTFATLIGVIVVTIVRRFFFKSSVDDFDSPLLDDHEMQELEPRPAEATTPTTTSDLATTQKTNTPTKNPLNDGRISLFGGVSAPVTLGASTYTHDSL